MTALKWHTYNLPTYEWHVVNLNRYKNFFDEQVPLFIYWIICIIFDAIAYCLCAFFAKYKRYASAHIEKQKKDSK